MVERLEPNNGKKKRRIKNSYVRQGLTFFIVGFALIIAYFCVNNIQVVGRIFGRMNDILMPFYLGIVMAFLVCPIYNGVVRIMFKLFGAKFSKQTSGITLSKAIATLVSVLVIIGAIAGVILLIVPDLLVTIRELIAQAPTMVNNVVRFVQKHMDENPEIAAFITERVGNIFDTADKWITTILPGTEALFNGILSGVVGTYHTFYDFIIGLIAAIYILLRKDTFLAQARKIVHALFKPEKAEKVFEFGRLVNETFGGFITGKIIDSIIIGILCFIVMNILGLPLSVLISVVVGITNIIPFFGPIIGAIPCSLLLLLIDPIAMVKFIILTVLIQIFDGNILGPKILGKATKIASFWVMFSIIVGGGLFGFVGMILGVPVFAVIYTYIRQGVNYKLEKRGYETNTRQYEDYSCYGADKDVVIQEMMEKEFAEVEEDTL